MGNAWIYSAVLWGIFVSVVGAVVGVCVVRKVARNDDPTTAAPRSEVFDGHHQILLQKCSASERPKSPGCRQRR